MNNTPVQIARVLAHDRVKEELTSQQAAAELRAKTVAWVHLDAKHDDARDWLSQSAQYLDPICMDALLAPNTRPSMTEFGDAILLILRGVNLNDGADPEDMISIRMWLDPQAIITLGIRRLKAVGDMDERIAAGLGPERSGAFLAEFVRRLTDRMEPTLRTLEDLVDALEERVLDDPRVDERRDIIEARRQIILLRRYIAPQRDAISALLSVELTWLTSVDRRDLRDSAERILRLVEDLDALRERAQVIGDELTNALSERLNRNLYVLSIVSAIFLPLGFLTGLLGINVAGMPGAETAAAFWWVVGGLVVVVIGQIAVFRWKHWF